MWPLASSLAYLLGIGGSWSDAGGYHAESVSELPVHLTLELDTAYVVEPGLAFGVHTRFSSAHAWEWDSDNTSATTWNYAMRSLDLGAAATVSGGPWFAEPWLGMHLAYTTRRTTRTTWGPPPTYTPMPDNSVDKYLEPFVGVGVLAGVDAVRTTRFRASMFAEIQGSAALTSRTGAGTKYTALTLGVAVRL